MNPRSFAWLMPAVATVLFSKVGIAQTDEAGSPPAVALFSLDPATGGASESTLSGPWKGEVGEGFRKGTEHAGFMVGAGKGFTILGSRNRHDLALTTADFGWILSDVKGDGHWYKGNWDLRMEAFVGSQFSPGTAYLVGAAPFLRYDFATGTPIVPFFELGAGASATDIRQDLSTTFEFNLQMGTGVEWFFTPHTAAQASVRMIHLSNARIHKPNQGVNTGMLYLGLEWFF
jgi:lipid A 3-O-deacylase